MEGRTLEPPGFQIPARLLTQICKSRPLYRLVLVRLQVQYRALAASLTEALMIGLY